MKKLLVVLLAFGFSVGGFAIETEETPAAATHCADDGDQKGSVSGKTKAESTSSAVETE